MALNSLGLGFVFTAKDQASAVIGNLTRQFKVFGKESSLASNRTMGAFLGLGASAGVMASGLAGVAGGFGLAKAAGEFQRRVAQTGAIANASAEEIERLHGAALDASQMSAFIPEDAILGLRELAALGFDVNESIGMLPPSLDLAFGGMISVEEATTAMGSALRVFQLDASKATDVADKLMMAANTTTLQADDFATAIGGVARGAVLTKQPLEEMLAVMGLVRNTGVEASVASHSVSSSLIFMSKRSDAFKKLGISLTDTHGKFRPVMDIFLETNKVLNRDFPNAADRAKKVWELFSRFGATAFAGFSAQVEKGIKDQEGNLLKGAAAVDFLRERMRNAQGTAEAFRKEQEKTFGGKAVLLLASFKGFITAVGDAFASALLPVMSAAIAVTRWLTSVWRALPEPLRKVIAGLFMLGSILTAIAGFFGVLAFAVALLIPFIKVAAIVFGVLAGVVLTLLAPVLLVIAAVIFLKRAIDQNVGGIAKTIVTWFNRIKLAFNGLADLFSRGGFSKAVNDEMEKAENEGVRNFVIEVWMAYHRIKAFLKGIGDAFDAEMGPMAAMADTVADAVGDIGKQLFGVNVAANMASTSTDEYRQKGRNLGSMLSTLAMSLMIVAVFILRVTQLVLMLQKAFMFLALGGVGVIVTALVKLYQILKAIASTIGILGGLFTPGEAGQAWKDIASMKGVWIPGITGGEEGAARRAQLAENLAAPVPTSDVTDASMPSATAHAAILRAQGGMERDNMSMAIAEGFQTTMSKMPAPKVTVKTYIDGHELESSRTEVVEEDAARGGFSSAEANMSVNPY